jgi:hypothetical protein
VDGGGDGGVDGMYLFLDGAHLREAQESIEIRKGASLDLFIIQAKNQAAFKESVFDKLSTGLGRLLSLDLTEKDLESEFSSLVLERRQLFKETYLKLAARHPQLHITIAYASRGDTSEIHTKVSGKADFVVESVKQRFPGAVVDRVFCGAKELAARAGSSPSYTLELPFVEYLTGRIGSAHVLLAGLEDYVTFVSDDKNVLRRHLFDSNVRDYQGEVEVNKEIARTLASGDEELDFWWLNNGVTILASKATVNGRRMMLDDVQIVNGLQTTETMYLHRKAGKSLRSHSILVKVVVTKDPASRDKIIKSTNFQTKIPDASLRATDQVQRNIESFLRSYDVFYDRRKNFHKNRGQPSHKIVSIPLLAQAHAAAVLREPQRARGKPSSLIKADADYKRAFSESVPLPLYLQCVKLLRLADDTFAEFPGEQRTNFRFHAVLVATMQLTGKRTYTSDEILARQIEDIDRDALKRDLVWMVEQAGAYQGGKGGSFNTISKASDFVEQICKDLPMEGGV